MMPSRDERVMGPGGRARVLDVTSIVREMKVCTQARSDKQHRHGAVASHHALHIAREMENLKDGNDFDVGS